MKSHFLTLLSSGLLFAACSTPPQTVALQPQVPAFADTTPAAQAEVRTRADADKSPPIRNEEMGMERRGPVSAPIYRQVVRIEEKPVYVDSGAATEQPVANAPTSGGVSYGYDTGYYYGRGYYRPYVAWHAPRFPVHTLIGASIGAAIGRRGIARERGAAIGASIGLMFDLPRIWH